MGMRISCVAAAMATFVCACTQSGAGAAQDNDPYLEMNTLLVANACSNCHAADYIRVGPSMVDIAMARGPESPEARKAMAEKILNGAQGSWGTAVMPAQAQLSPEKARELASAILSLKAAQ